MFAFLENRQKCRSPPPMLPRAAELPCGGATFFINPEPLALALTSHNLVSDSNPNPQHATPLASPSSSLLPPRMTLHHYQITGTRQRGNDSCQWALKSTPPFQLKRVTSFLGPTARISLLFFFLFFCCVLFQGSQVLSRRVERSLYLPGLCSKSRQTLDVK